MNLSHTAEFLFSRGKRLSVHQDWLLWLLLLLLVDDDLWSLYLLMYGRTDGNLVRPEHGRRCLSKAFHFVAIRKLFANTSTAPS